MTSSILTFISATVAALLLAPCIGRCSKWLGIVDRPDGHRKLHSRVVPLTGGPTLVIAIAISVALTMWFFPNLLTSSYGDIRFLIALGLSSLVIVAVGLMDDRFGLRGRQKLVGQFLAALIMLPSGIVIRKIELFGFPIEFGDLAPVLTIFWILGAINALNLIDGVDGLASTTGIILSLSVAAVTAILGGRPDGLMISLALAGALCGFLVFNFPPARMFLGDSGSMLIGLVLGAVALKCTIKQYSAIALIMPTAIWAIPIFDVSMAIVRRRLTGRSIYSTDRGHLHHCLVRRGHAGSRLLLVVAALCGLTGLGAIASAAFQNDLLAVLSVVTALLLLVLTRSFGHAELMLLANRVRRFVGTLFRQPEGAKPVLHHEQVRLHGKHKWENLWATLTEFAEEYQLDGVELLVNVPSAGEEYHGSWRTKSRVEPHEACRSDIPLVIDGMKAGHVRLVGVVEGVSFCEWMAQIAVGLRPFEEELRQILQEFRNPRTDSVESLSESGSLLRMPRMEKMPGSQPA